MLTSTHFVIYNFLIEITVKIGCWAVRVMDDMCFHKRVQNTVSSLVQKSEFAYAFSDRPVRLYKFTFSNSIKYSCD